nr:hypothetical protein [Candidatus Njordarchaeota archaeon]
MKLELIELVKDAAASWLWELFKEVVESLSTSYLQSKLVITDSFRRAKSALEFNKSGKSLDLGITGIASISSQLKESDYEYVPWEGAGQPDLDTFYLLIKPARVRELDETYDSVRGAMAHEVSEGIVVKEQQERWLEFHSPEEIRRLYDHHSQPDGVLNVLQTAVRERLADEYSARHGFGIDILSTLTTGCLANFASSIPTQVLASTSRHRLAFPFILAWDRSVSLELAGENTLARMWIKVWGRYVKKEGKLLEKLYNSYLKSRSGYLLLPLSVDSLLVSFNRDLLAISKTS